MFSNDYLENNTDENIVKDTAELFPQTFQIANGYESTDATFQNLTPSTNVLQEFNNGVQPKSIITYPNTKLQPIEQDIYESVNPKVLQTQPINEEISKNKTILEPIIQSQILPSKTIQSSPTIEKKDYLNSVPVAEIGLALEKKRANSKC